MRERRLALLLLVPVGLGVVFSLLRFTLEGFDVPQEEDYAGARAEIEALGPRAGVDAVAALPAWSLRAHKHLRGLRPISGDELAAQPLDRYRRLFVVVEPDASRPLRALERRLGPPKEERRVGRLVVAMFELTPRYVTFDFRERLGEAEIRIVGRDGGTIACDERLRGGFQCRGKKSWQRVSRQRLLVSENGDDAIWAHPPERGERLEIAFSDVQIGDEIVVRAGHTRHGADRATAPVRLAITIDGVEVARLSRAPRFSFAADRFDTKAFAGRRARVVFRIDSDDSGTNHFAFDAYTVAPAREGA